MVQTFELTHNGMTKGQVDWTGVLLHEIDVQIIKVIHQAY